MIMTVTGHFSFRPVFIFNMQQLIYNLIRLCSWILETDQHIKCVKLCVHFFYTFYVEIHTKAHFF